MNMQYSSSLYQKSTSFRLPTFGLEWLFPSLAGAQVSCGGWMTVTTDRVQQESLSANTKTSAGRELYGELDDYHIRLLTIYPAEYHQPLEGKLCTCYPSVHCKPQYVALSYVWGKQDGLGTIFLEDHAMPITQTLEKCFRYLRSETKEVCLWVDSICINQANVSEKSNQVKLMDCVYQGAQEVKVWLGDETEYSWVGMRVLRYFAENAAPTTDAPWLELPPGLVLKGLSDVMQRDWFRRMWVVQEVALARRVSMICGPSSVSWSDDATKVRKFMRMIKYAAIQPEWIVRGLARVDMFPLLELLDLQLGRQLDRSWGTTHRTAPDILDIAYDLRHRLSSDPRDMIFALHGIVKDMSSGERLNPDYTMTVEEAYKHLTDVIDF